MADEFSEAVEIIPGRYYVAFLKRGDSPSYSTIAASSVSYCIDSELLYEPFYADFGPLNLGKTYRFCEHTKQLLEEAEKLGRRLYLYTGPQPQAKANAAVLVGAFQVLYLNRSPDDAYAPLARQGPWMPFRDASCGIPTFNLQPIDCIRGIAKARDCGFIDASGGSWRFDLAEYEHYEQVENGDLNWIVPGKLVAFSGPAARPTDYVGFRAMVPEDYWDYYHKKGVQAIVRLNKKVYDRKRFLDGGFQHHELYFPDGSCPSQEILLRFLSIAESTPGALAIHCKAGLGRTGVLICGYIMKHYKFTAEEVIGYIRICRPGSVIGPQQGFIRDIQRFMWMEGDAYRAVNGPQPPPLMWGVTPATAAAAAATAAACSSKATTGAVHAVNLTVDATGQQQAAFVPATAAAAAARSPALGHFASQKETPSTPFYSVTHSIDKSLSDLSLKQLQDRISHSTASTSHSGRPGMIRTPSSSGGGSSTGGSYSNSSNSGKGTGSISFSNRMAGITPQRLFSSPAPAATAVAGPLTGNLMASRPSTSQQILMRSTPVGTATTATAAAAAAAGYHQPGRSASAHRERPSGSSSSMPPSAAAGSLLSNSIASLRATLHTDTVAAAHRFNVTPDVVISQSSDFAGSGWRTPLTPGAVPGSSRPSSTIARVLAPNGQPRKLPAAALAAALSAPTPVATNVSAGAMVKGTALQAPTTPQQGTSGRLSAYYSN